MATPRIDAHQHFWKFDPVRDSWIGEEMAVIQRDFLPPDLKPVIDAAGFDGCVTVQSDQSEAENAFQLEHARSFEFIKGIVGWVDLRAENISERLDHYKQFPQLKGFRHVLQGEPQRDLMLRPDFLRGIEALGRAGFTYDILVFPDQLPFVQDFVFRFPDLPLVIDHLAKPYIKKGEVDVWAKDLRAIAAAPNVCCKVSGMVTEADWKGWKPEDFSPYLDLVTEVFGPNRLMYGSDWPVCLVAGGYEAALSIVRNYYSSFSPAEQEAIFGGTAIKFYNLK